MESDIHNTS